METHKLCVIWVLLSILFFVDEVRSQEKSDWCSWTGVTVNYKINDRMRLMSKTEVRSKDNISDFERFFINGGVGYKVLPKWELRGVLAYHRRSSSSKGDYNAYRYHIGSEASWKYGDFKIQWRERFQHTYLLEENELLIRSRLKFDYYIPSSMLAPYFSVETFNNIRNGSFFNADRVRYTPGMRVKLSETYSVSAFYCRQDDGAKKSNIAGVEFFINL